jgi:AraC-like DNA-binding protein
MTAAAKELTNRANLQNGGTDGNRTAPASTLRIFLNALGRLGYDTHSLLAAAGVSRSQLDDPEARIACNATPALLGAAMRMRPLKNLGMRIAAETPIGAFPLLDYLIVTCDLVSDGVKQLARYLRLADAPYSLEAQGDEDPIRIVFLGNRDAFTCEFGVSLTLLHLREETEARLSAEYVSFSHRPDDVHEMEQVLDCPVRSGESWNGFSLSREAWKLPLRRHDPVLRGVLEQNASEVTARLPAIDGIAGELRQVLISRITHGDTEIQSVARTLATSTRSLQRRLAAAGTTYQELLDSTRREAAARYLADNRLSVGEVTYLLGYSEPAAFHRAFKRWHGSTPQEFRQRQSISA